MTFVETVYVVLSFKLGTRGGEGWLLGCLVYKPNTKMAAAPSILHSGEVTLLLYLCFS